MPDEETQRRFERLEHRIFGNGRTGLDNRVTVVETQFNTIKKLLYLLVLVSVPQLFSMIADWITF